MKNWKTAVWLKNIYGTLMMTLRSQINNKACHLKEIQQYVVQDS